MRVATRYLLLVAAMCSVSFAAGMATMPGADALDAIGAIGASVWFLSGVMMLVDVRALERDLAP